LKHAKDFFLNHKKLCVLSFLFLLLFFGIFLSSKAAEPYAHITPNYPQEEIISVFLKEELNEEDYKKILFQTGLGKQAVDYLRKIRPKTMNESNMEYNLWKSKVDNLHKKFFEEINFTHKANTPISCEEILIDEDGNPVNGISFVGLEDGDILVTKCSRIYGWRNGHAALVIDVKNEKTIESVVLGEDSCIQNLRKWKHYPNVMVFRLKGKDQAYRKKIADWAIQNMENLPYRLSVGILSKKDGKEGKYDGTQCAHLVWAAYWQFGYDLDGDGGKIVTPKDLANSSCLEIVQLYGTDPEEPWK